VIVAYRDFEGTDQVPDLVFRALTSGRAALFSSRRRRHFLISGLNGIRYAGGELVLALHRIAGIDGVLQTRPQGTRRITTR